MQKETSRLNWIDLLRGLASVGVIAAHSTIVAQSGSNNLLSIFSLGKFGPQLFYTLSAMTLFLSLNSTSNKSNNQTNFFIKRFFRIAPLYYIMMTIYILFHVDSINPFDSSLFKYQYADFSILTNILFLHSFGHEWINDVVPGGWSVGIEFLFYFFTPFLFSKITSLRKAIYFLVISSVIQKFGFLLMDKYLYHSTAPTWPLYSYCYIGNNLPYFAMGIVLFFLIFKKEKLNPFMIFLLCANWVFFRNPLNVSLTAAYVIFAIIMLAQLSISISESTMIKPLLFLGKISYSLYLTNFIGIRLWDYIIKNYNFTVNYLTSFICSLTIITVISMITYYLIEEPAQRYGKSLLRK